MSLPQPLSSQGAYFTWKISHGTAPNKNVKKDTYDGLTVLEKLLKLILDVFILYDLDCTLHLSDLISNYSTLWQLNYVHLRCIFTVGSKQSHPSAAAPCARRLWLPSSANVVLCDHIMTSRITEERPSCHLTRDFLPMWFWCEGSLFFFLGWWWLRRPSPTSSGLWSRTVTASPAWDYGPLSRQLSRLWGVRLRTFTQQKLVSLTLG